MSEAARLNWSHDLNHAATLCQDLADAVYRSRDSFSMTGIFGDVTAAFETLHSQGLQLFMESLSHPLPNSASSLTNDAENVFLHLRYLIFDQGRPAAA